ncbi:MAG: nuclear transport factor 2 family protein [Gemmatimonadota bacterium]|nr:nuclear transport factor 2 family protein [Gemmatimonadota bacterium]
MRRFLALALGAMLLATACKVERTPRRFYSGQTPAETEVRVREEQIRARVLALGESVARGDLNGALLALAAGPDALLVGPEESGWVTGAGGATGVVQSLIGLSPPSVHVDEVRVEMEEGAELAWFSAMLTLERSEGDEPIDRPLRITGIYQRTRGDWALVQAHFSLPDLPPTQPSDSASEAPPPEGA